MVVFESVDSAPYSISKHRCWNIGISEITDEANRTLDFVERNVRTKINHLKN